MQPSESAFDRVKSLLGKMDRSIDEARRRRLHADDGDEHAIGASEESPTESDQSGGDSGTAPPSGSLEEPPHGNRPTSKYGRATPLRELHSRQPPAWREH